jgi:hypothetical protein
VEATIKTLATKDDIEDLAISIRKANTDIIKWIFFFWITQVAATYIIFSLLLKK